MKPRCASSPASPGRRLFLKDVSKPSGAYRPLLLLKVKSRRNRVLKPVLAQHRPHASNSVTTLAFVTSGSVNRSGRPLCRYVRRR